MSTFEDLVSITNTATGYAFPCTAKELRQPLEFRTAVAAAAGAPGGADDHAGGYDELAPRQVSVTLIHEYGPGESFTSVYEDLDRALLLGAAVELHATDARGDDWYAVARTQRVDKAQTLGFISHVEIPITFVLPDPLWHARYKSGVLRADTGLVADTTPALYADVDPDSFPLTAQNTPHYIQNTGPGVDRAPRLVLTGTAPYGIPGPVTVINYGVVTRFTKPGDPSSGPAQYLYLRYNRAVAPGETVTIDCAEGDVTSTAAVDAFGSTAFPAGQDQWFLVTTGQNPLVVSAGSAALSGFATIAWLPRKS